jgi:TolB-like protein/Flp pilus assembly protein TadD
LETPFPAYRGDEPYIFVCYAHEDSDTVYRELERLNAAGVNLWYDEGISPGHEWTQELANAINGASQFMFFASRSSVESRNCRDEIQYAKTHNKQLLSIYLESTTLPGGLELSIGLDQAIRKYELSETDYRRKLGEAIQLSSATGTEPSPVITADPISRVRRIRISLAALLALVVLVTTTWWLQSDDEPSHPNIPDIPSIAVLPLKNVSGEDDQDYLGEAISSEVWAKLTRVNGLRVISMTSSSAFRDSNLNIKEIGRRLTADFLVEGTAMQSGNIVRMNVHLSDARDGTELWGTSLTRMIDTPQSFFALYDEISGEIGKALPEYVVGINALGEKTEPPTHKIAAYNLLIRAEYALSRTGDAKEALALANQAVELDPDFAGAHGGVSAFLQIMAEFGQASPMPLLVEAEVAARRALEIDPTYGDGYRGLAMIYDRLYLDWGQAMAAYQEADAHRVHPDSLAHSKQDLLLNAGRYEDGLALVVEGAGRNPGDGMWPLYIARFLYRLERYSEAKQSIEKAIQLSPENGFVVFVAIDHLLRMNATERAEQVLEQLVESNPRLKDRWAAELSRGRLALVRGDQESLRSSVSSWVANREERFVPAQQISNAYYELGDYDNYFHWFEVRVEERHVLGWVMDELRYRPGYELSLKQWAKSDPEEADRRSQLVADHLELLENVTQKMAL